MMSIGQFCLCHAGDFRTMGAAAAWEFQGNEFLSLNTDSGVTL